MVRTFLLLIGFIFLHISGIAQQYKVDTLQYNGPKDNVVNLVILADGYTKDELAYFRIDAQKFVTHFFKTEPFAQYVNYFNVFTINTISEESGATHDCTGNDCPKVEHNHDDLPVRFNEYPKRIAVPKANPKTIFGSSFDNYGIHRLVIPQNSEAIREVLKTHLPEYTQVVVLVNSPYYGGSGGEFATATVNFDSNDIAVHEIGHSFAKLADEYWAGNMYAIEGPNRSQKANANEVPWKHWVGTNGVGVYSYGGGDSRAQWFRPHEFCKMQYLVAPFCNVCQEVFVETIHRNSNPILGSKPLHTATLDADSIRSFSIDLLRPVPNTLQVKWYLNNELIASNIDSIQVNLGTLQIGLNKLEAVVTDTTNLVRNPRHHQHTNKLAWTIDAKKEYALRAPESTWGAVIENCYNGYQALSIKKPEAGLEFNWYDAANNKLLATTHNYVTPQLKENKVYYVTSKWKNKVSPKTEVKVNLLSPIGLPEKVVTQTSEDGKTIEVTVVDADKAFNYIWTNEDGTIVFPWDIVNNRYEWRHATDGKIVVLKDKNLRKIYVHKVDKIYTCVGERIEVKLK